MFPPKYLFPRQHTCVSGQNTTAHHFSSLHFFAHYVLPIALSSILGLNFSGSGTQKVANCQLLLLSSQDLTGIKESSKLTHMVVVC